MAQHVATADEHTSGVTQHGDHAHHPALQHHFDNMEQQRDAGSIGMWVFLVTEIMFFGGMFLAYIIYRVKYPLEFAAGSYALDVTLGGVNTAVLIGSSLTMALAVFFAQVGVRKLLITFLLLTVLLGGIFLGIKAVEYKHKFDHHTYPGLGFKPDEKMQPEWESKHAADIQRAAQEGYRFDVKKVQMFYFIYFAMTGIHALHMIIGMALMLVLTYMAWRGRFSPEYHGPVELSGLYWHFVDIVWIFLFPLLYLIGRN